MENLPAMELLKSYKNWVCWGRGYKDGKLDKTPYQPNGLPAKSNDKSTWSTYEECVNARGFNGIGFQFDIESGIVGLDFDHCVADGVIDARVSRIINHINSYTEFSPSGNGIHILLIGTPSETGRFPIADDLDMEVYNTHRYFTITGNTIANSPLTIEERDAELDDVLKSFPKPTPTQSVRAVVANAQTTGYNTLWLERFLENKIQDAVHNIAMAGNSNRHDTRRANARVVGGYAQAVMNAGLSRVDEDDIIRRLYNANIPAKGAQRKEMNVIIWGFENGLRNPLELPPMKEKPLATPQKPSTPKKDAANQELPRTIEQIASEPTVGGMMDSNERQWLETEYYAEFFTDAYFSGYVIRNFNDNLRYDQNLDMFLLWDGKVWKEGNRNDITIIMERYMEIVNDLVAYANSIASPKLLKIVTNYLNIVKISPIVKMIKSTPAIQVKTTDFNQHIDLLCVKNGVVDLQTGKLLPHNRTYLFTKMLDINYTPEAKHTFLDKFMNDIFAGDSELIRFVKHAIGYTLTGSTRSQCLFYMYGTGANGKSIFNTMMQRLLGQGRYYDKIDAEVILSQPMDGSKPQPFITQLVDKRMVAVTEPDLKKSFKESLVKDLTGGESIKVRTLNAEPISFTPRFKMWVSANDKLRVKESNHGFWRRIKMIPFNVTFKKEDMIPQEVMIQNFDDELEGILAWAVEGAIAWYKEGLPKCRAVDDATQQYVDEEDVVGRFIKERMRYVGMGFVNKNKVYDAWKSWLYAEGIDNDMDAQKVKNKIGDKIREIHGKDYKVTGGTDNKCYLGYRLLTENELSDNEPESEEEETMTHTTPEPEKTPEQSVMPTVSEERIKELIPHICKWTSHKQRPHATPNTMRYAIKPMPTLDELFAACEYMVSVGLLYKPNPEYPTNYKATDETKSAYGWE